MKMMLPVCVTAGRRTAQADDVNVAGERAEERIATRSLSGIYMENRSLSAAGDRAAVRCSATAGCARCFTPHTAHTRFHRAVLTTTSRADGNAHRRRSISCLGAESATSAAVTAFSRFQRRAARARSWASTSSRIVGVEGVQREWPGLAGRAAAADSSTSEAASAVEAWKTWPQKCKACRVGSICDMRDQISVGHRYRDSRPCNTPRSTARSRMGPSRSISTATTSAPPSLRSLRRRAAGGHRVDSTTGATRRRSARGAGGRARL